MKFAKATKKITAIAASAALATSAAMAASNYPANFENSGVTVVVGSSAAASDMTAAESIISDIEAANAGESNNVVITYRNGGNGGEQALIADSGNVLKLGSTIDSTNGVKTTSFDDRDLDLLNDETLRVGTTNVDYTQEIEILDGRFEHSFRDRLEDSMSQKLFFDRNKDLFSYKVDFKTDIANEDFTVENLQGKKLILLGNEYTIADVKNSTYEMKLLGGSNTISLGEGESSSVSVGGNSYNVEVMAVSGTNTDRKVLLSINGETKSLDEFESDIIGGVRVVVTDLVPSSRDSVKGYAEVVVGGNEILLRNGNEVELNDEKISKEITDYYVEVAFDETPTTGDLTGMTFTYKWLGSDGIILRAGEVLEDKLFNAFGVKFDGINNVDYEETVITASRDAINLNTKLIGGSSFSKDIAFAEEMVDGTDTTAVLRAIGDNRDVPMLTSSINFGTQHNVTEVGNKTNGDAIYTVDASGTIIFSGEQVDIENLFVLDGAFADGVGVRGFKATGADNGLMFLAQQNSDTQYLYKISGYSRDSNNIADDELTILDQNNKGASNQRFGADAGDAGLIADKLTRVSNFVLARHNGTGIDGTSTNETYISQITLDSASSVLSLSREGLLNIGDLNANFAAADTASLTFTYDWSDLRLDDNSDANTTSYVFSIAWDGSDDELEITLDGASTGYISDFGGRDYVSSSNRDLRQVVDAYGTIVEYDSDKRDRITIMVPEEQVEARAYLVAGDVSASTMTKTVSADAVEAAKAELEADGYTIVSTNSASSTPVSVDVTGPVMDSDVASNENLIVVGGPAVNMVARELMGLSSYNYETDAGVAPGQGIARYFEEENTVLVYGYSAADTVAVVERLNAGTVNFQ